MMDLVPGHYPRPQSIVDFKLDAIDGRSLSSSWFETKQMTATERDLSIATNRLSLTAQTRWFRCDEATLRLYLPERVEEKNCRNKRCRQWWYCRRLVGNNKNNEDSSLPCREANSNSFFGHGFPPCKRILWIQKILRLWLMRISQKILAAGQTKILI